MTIYTDNKGLYRDLSTIKVRFDNSVFQKILDICKVNDPENATTPQIEKIFINSIHHYQLGNLHLDELAWIAGYYWPKREERFDELASALYECSELNFYARRVIYPEEPNFKGNFIQFMETTMKYYEAHGNLVIKKESKHWE